MAALTLEDARRISGSRGSEGGRVRCWRDDHGRRRRRSRPRPEPDGCGALWNAERLGKQGIHRGLVRAPSKILTGLTQPGQSLFGFADAAGGRIAIFGGGVPLIRGDEVLGAIGVSGGSVEQDQDIADAGAAAL